MKLPSWDMLGHIRDVTPQQLETTLKVRFLWGSAKSCTVYDFFKLFTIAQSPYVMAVTLVRCSICALFIRVFFTRPFSKRGHIGTAHFYGTLMKYVDSLPAPTLSILGTLFQCQPASLRRHLCGISLRTFRIQLEQINQNGKMWPLNRFLSRNRSLEHHQQCLNLVSTNTRSLEIATASHSQNSVKCCVCSGVIVSSLNLGLPPSLRRDVAAGAFRIVTILGVKFHSDVTYGSKWRDLGHGRG